MRKTKRRSLKILHENSTSGEELNKKIIEYLNFK